MTATVTIEGHNYTLPQAYQLGQQMLLAGRTAEADSLFHNVLAQHPGNAHALLGLGYAAARTGNTMGALDYVNQAYNADTSLPDIYELYSHLCAQLGNLKAVVRWAQEGLTHTPQAPNLLARLAKASYMLGDHPAALAAYRQLLEIAPDHAEARHIVAALEGQSAAPRANHAYVATLFDKFHNFEEKLVGELAYRTPQELMAAFHTATGIEKADWNIVDLGCGTGLMGELVREHTDILVGVDLSERMLERAGRKAVYDRLVAADAIDFLSGEPDSSADLIVAADMVPYVGSLVALFGSVARVLAGGGVFAFSCERHDGEGFVLGEHLRYRHSAGLLAEAAAEAGLSLLTAEPAVLRREAGAGVAGLVCELVRPADIMPLTPRPAGRRGRLAKAA